MANMVTSIVLELVDRVTRPVRRIQQSLSGLSRRAGFDRLAGAARRVGGAMSHAVGQARAFGERMLMLGGVTAGAVWGVERLVSGVTDVGNAVQESAERLGVGTTWLQEWQYVGRQFGVENDALVDGLKELSLRADEFVMTAGGPAAEAFGRLGIGLNDLRATGGDTAAMFDLVRSRMGRLENDAARQRVMDEIFGGQGGEQMVAMLGATREELEALMRQGRNSGSFLDEDAIEQSREYTRQMGDLRSALFGIQRSVVGDLLPAITDWIERMRELATANREAISERILQGLQEFWAGLQQVGRVVSRVADQVGGYGNLVAILAGVLSVQFVAAVAMAIKSLIALGVTLMATPLGWFLAAVAAVAGAAYLIYRNWDGIVEWFGSLWDGIQAWFTQGIGGIMRDLASWHPAALFLRAIDAVFEMFGARPLSAIAGEWLSGVADQVAALWAEVGERFSQGVAAAIDWVAALWRGVQAWFSQGIGGIMRSLARWSPAGLVVQALDAIFEAFGARPLSAVVAEWLAGVPGRVAALWVSIGEWFDQGMADVLRSLARWSPMAVVVRAIDGIFRAFGARPLSTMVAEWFAGVRERVTALWADMQAWFSQGIGAVARDVLAFNPAQLLGRVIDEVFALFAGRPLSQVGAEWIGTLVGSLREAWQALPDWAEGRLEALGEVFANFSLAEIGGAWIDSLRAGISERWEGLTGWLSARVDGLTAWMPDWARERLGIQSAPPAPGGAPQAALGAPVAEGRPSAMPAPARAEVGGELRIVVDSEGRPRVAEARRRGGMEFDVMSGGLGVMP